MSDPGAPGLRRGGAFTWLQFILFAATGLIALAGLLAAGLALGLALAAAGLIAVLVLVAWVVASNLLGNWAQPPAPRG